MGDVAFGEVVSRAELVSVQPIEFSAKRRAPSVADQQEILLDDEHSALLEDGGKQLKVTYRFRVQSEDDEEGSAPTFEATVLYGLTYAFDPPLTGEHQSSLELFAEHNGRYNCWPFLRAYLSRTTAELGLPNLTLPLLKPFVPKANSSPKKSELLE